MDWTGILTLAIALIGATLGVGNFVWSVWRDKVRIGIRFEVTFVPNGATLACGVTVVNFSYFAVTVEE